MSTPEADRGVAVILCTRDRPHLLGDALDAVMAAIRPSDEVVVVDSGSTDPHAVDPARQCGVTVVRLQQPGLSRARNAGVEATSAPIVAFTDDDCRPAAGWAEVIARSFRDPGVGFMTGRAMADRVGRISVSCKLDEEPLHIAAAADPFSIGVGANMAMRRIALEGVGGFDERLGAGARIRAGEDVDAWCRLIDAGWEGRYDPGCIVTHVQWRSDAQALRLSYGYGLGAGALAMKGIRSGRPGSLGLLGQRLWADGVGRALSDLRHGYQSGAAASLLQAAGALSGALQAARWSRRP